MSVNCPGENSTIFCEAGGKCAKGSICYSDITKGKTQCCSKLNVMCTATNMITHFNKTKDVYQHKWSSALDADRYYKDPLTGAGCSIPYAFSLFFAVKVKPSAFTPLIKRPIGECKTNADCHVNEFCGAPVNWIDTKGTDSSNNGKSRRFCYTKPELPEYFEIFNRPAEVDLPFCHDNSQCSKDEICYITDEWKGKLRADSGLPVNGICVKVSTCEVDHVSLYAHRLDSGFCDKDEDCKHVSGFGIAEYSPLCLPFNDKDGTQKLCCFRKRAKCTRGYKNLPAVKCSSTSDCNTNTTVWTNWCDPNEKECCSEDGDNWASPDGVIPLYNEPACEGVVEGEPTSGTCPTDTNAKCLNGHCHQAGEMVDGRFAPGTFDYRTNFPCKSDTLLPESIIYAFCDFETKRVVKLGSTRIAEIDGEKSCEQDSDCSTDGTYHCVHKGSGERGCARKQLPAVVETTTTEEPLIATPDETDPYIWLYTVGPIVAILVLVALVSIGVYCCRRRNKKESNSLATVESGLHNPTPAGTPPVVPIVPARVVDPPAVPIAPVRVVDPPAVPIAPARVVDPPAVPIAPARVVDPPAVPLAPARVAAPARGAAPPAVPIAPARVVDPPAVPIAPARVAAPARGAAPPAVPIAPVPDGARQDARNEGQHQENQREGEENRPDVRRGKRRRNRNDSDRNGAPQDARNEDQRQGNQRNAEGNRREIRIARRRGNRDPNAPRNGDEGEDSDPEDAVENGRAPENPPGGEVQRSLQQLRNKTLINRGKRFLTNNEIVRKIIQWIASLTSEQQRRIFEMLNESFDDLEPTSKHCRTVAQADMEGKCRYPGNPCILDTLVTSVPGTFTIHQNYILLQICGLLSKLFLSEAPFVDVPGHVETFLDCIFNSSIVAVFMLARPLEEGKEKCSLYFPDKGKPPVTIGKYTISWDEEFTEDISFVTQSRTLKITRSDGKVHTVRHIFNRGWDDHSRHMDFNQLMEMLMMAIAFMEQKAPILVHCSAGTGRTGTFVALLMVAENPNNVDLIAILKTLRESRAGAVQNWDQFSSLLEFPVKFMKYLGGDLQTENFVDELRRYTRDMNNRNVIRGYNAKKAKRARKE